VGGVGDGFAEHRLDSDVEFTICGGIAEHPSECNADCEDGYRGRCGTREHPSRSAAERATTVSPRGEMNVTRPALHSEGCSIVPYGSLYPSTSSTSYSVVYSLIPAAFLNNSLTTPPVIPRFHAFPQKNGRVCHSLSHQVPVQHHCSGQRQRAGVIYMLL
jgi:hypothetical protein